MSQDEIARRIPNDAMTLIKTLLVVAALVYACVQLLGSAMTVWKLWRMGGFRYLSDSFRTCLRLQQRHSFSMMVHLPVATVVLCLALLFLFGTDYDASAGSAWGMLLQGWYLVVIASLALAIVLHALAPVSVLLLGKSSTATLGLQKYLDGCLYPPLRVASLLNPALLTRAAVQEVARGMSEHSFRADFSNWQHVVTAFAGQVALVVVDIRDSSEHVAWELGELQRLELHYKTIFLVQNPTAFTAPPGSLVLQTKEELRRQCRHILIWKEILPSRENPVSNVAA